MHALHEEKARACIVIRFAQFGGIELGFGFQVVQKVLVTGFRRMAEIACR